MPQHNNSKTNSDPIEFFQLWLFEPIELLFTSWQFHYCRNEEFLNAESWYQSHEPREDVDDMLAFQEAKEEYIRSGEATRHIEQKAEHLFHFVVAAIASIATIS